MNRERYERVQDLFHQALELKADEREAFLAELAREDSELRDEVVSLLGSHEEGSGLLGTLDDDADDATEQLDRISRALAGRYEIEAEAGRGGMATVYRAKDLKHHRTVAIKVLHPFLAHSLGVDRFLAEIETTAGLLHPHILPLFDSGEADGLLFYVMPFVEGESLRQRLERERQLPVEDAVQIATRMAEALDYAHRRNVIHRDIKPGNVLLQDGQPAIADFGIALAVGAARTDRLTQAGHSLGTPRYMSPEQVTGDQVVGPASDQYALACVLHEMLVGEPPHTGGSTDSVLRKIVRGLEVSPREVRKSIPRHVDSAIRRALERLPADRFREAKDFAQALVDPTFRYGDQGEAAAAGRWRSLALGFASLLAIVTGVAAWSWLRPEPPAPVQRFTVTPPPARAMISPYIGVGLALSSAGDQLVYVGVGPEGQQLWHRRLDALTPTPVPWTEGAENPVFSPDGSTIAFREGANLKTVSLRGGIATVLLSEGITGRYMDWGPDGFIYLASDSIIARVRPSGGSLEPFTTKFPGARTRLPRALPDNAGLLVTLRKNAAAQATIGVVGPNGGEVRELLPGLSARYAASGHLVYGTPGGTMMAAPFDLDRLEVTGESRVVVEGLDVRIPGLGAQFSISDDGTLAYRTAATADLYQPVWVDRSGGSAPIESSWSFAADLTNSSLALSPSGDRLLMTQPRGVGGGSDIWMKDLEDGSLTRLTTEGIQNRRPSWSPDGTAVHYVHVDGSGPEVRQRQADGAGGAPTVLLGAPQLTGAGVSPPSEAFVSNSGEWLVVRTGSTDDRSNPDIYGMRLGVDTLVRPLVAASDVEWAPNLSPDGRWLAYASDESGRREVYVRPFPDVDSGKHRVSESGGDNPVWSRSGTELFYRDGADQLVSAQVSTGGGFSIASRSPLFSASGYLRGDGHPMYDVAPDGDRFVMLARAPVQALAELVIVQNWFEELTRLVPTTP